MRTFIAIDLPENLKREISLLKVESKVFRWIPPAQIHLTVNFLGETNVETLNLLIDNLRKIKSKPFELELKSSGFLPSNRRPSVLWLGVSESPHLLSLKKSIDSIVGALCPTFEKKQFKPHVTIARIARFDSNELERVAKSTHSFRAMFHVDSFMLYSSELRSEGAVYSRVGKFRIDETDLD